MKYLLLLIFLLFSLSQSVAQSWEWANKSEGYYMDPENFGHAVDHEGNSYIAGYFGKEITYGRFTLLSTAPSTYSDIFITKVDAKGNVKWLKQIEHVSSYEKGIAICLNNDQGFYLTGSRGSQLFVAKYDTAGNQKWFTDFPTKYDKLYGDGKSISVDGLGNVYMAGNNTGNNAFITKLSADGNILWTNIITSDNSRGCAAIDIAVDEYGNSFVAGWFNADSINVGKTTLFRGEKRGEIPFLVKLDKYGKYLWVKSAKNGRFATPPQVVLTEDNSVYLAGSFFYDSVTFDSITIKGIPNFNSDESPYLLKYDTDGNLKWGKLANTHREVTPGREGNGNPKDLKVDYDGNIYLTGSYFTSWGGTVLDSYIEKYDKTGSFKWSRVINTSGEDNILSIDLDKYGNIYATGNFINLEFVGGEEGTYRAVGCAKLRTDETTRRRPYQPLTEGIFAFCDNVLPASLKLDARGQNLRWYRDQKKTNLLATGNSYTYAPSSTDTIYVTQTENGIESWAKPIVFFLSKLKAVTLTLDGDSLRASLHENATYSWYRNDILLTNKTNSCLAKLPGEYKVIVSEYGLCSKSSSFIIGKILSVDEKSDEIAFYPNPVNNVISISGNIQYKSILNYSILNTSGSTIKSIQPINGVLTDRLDIDVNDLQSGVYFLKIRIDERSKVLRFIKL